LGSILGWLGVIMTSFFILMVTSLIAFHTYLAANNLTTWESLSWKKISYMKIWPRKYGSPFFISYTENLRIFFSSKVGFHSWKMPISLPSFDEGA
jgi:hypothetical protein